MNWPLFLGSNKSLKPSPNRVKPVTHAIIINDGTLLSGPDQYLAIFESAGLKGVTLNRLHDVNYFYRRHKNLIFRLANANTVFLVKGEKLDDI